MAGEWLVAIGDGGACLVQFSKPPFTLATARLESGQWTLEMLSSPRHDGGRGQPTKPILWFALAEVVRGKSVANGWQFESRGEAGWRLTHPSTGETVEGFEVP